MPYAPNKPCASCHRQLVPSGRIRCEACDLRYSRTRNSARGGSGWTWAQWIREVIARDGGCVLGGPHGMGDEARLVVDHIRPIADGGQTVMENLRTLCLLHHKLITKAWRIARAAR